MKTQNHRTKYKTTAMVCSYVMATKQFNGRAIAKKLGIHFTTWHRYVRGDRTPSSALKTQLVAMMGTKNFLELIHLAFRSTHKR